MKLLKDTDQLEIKKHEISDEKAEEAIRTIIQWIGEDPKREGLLSTPQRVIKAFREYFYRLLSKSKRIFSKNFYRSRRL